MENPAQRILMIEDNEQNMYLMTYLFEGLNYEIFQAFSGKAGVEKARQLSPDIILLDIELPEMDGYAVARKIREDEKLRKVPIIVVTSYAMAGDMEKSYLAGATGYIEKPINPDTFVDLVLTFVKGK